MIETTEWKSAEAYMPWLLVCKDSVSLSQLRWYVYLKETSIKRNVANKEQIIIKKFLTIN